MDMKLEIICNAYKHKKAIENKIIVNEPQEEYYIIPITKKYKIHKEKDMYKLTFHNQLLWLKYSNYKKYILLKEYDFEDFIIINSKDIIDIYVEVQTTQCFRKNVWHTRNSVPINKKYGGKYFLIIPIFDNIIDIKKYGIGIEYYQIHLITNEVLLKKASERSKNGCNLSITNNCMLNKEALFIVLNDNDVEKFI